MNEYRSKHFVLTRFNIRIASMLTKQLDAIDVSRDEKYLQERFRLFFDYTVPSMLNQTVKDFVWIIMFSDNTPKHFKSRVDEMASKNPFVRIVYIKDEENSTRVLNSIMAEYKSDIYITSRVDNDDALAKTYIEEIQNYVLSHDTNNKYALIFNNGYQYEEKAGVVSKYHFPKNHFSTLVAPCSDNIDSILNYGHMNIEKKVKVHEVENETPMWLEVVHATNVSNRMHYSSADIITDSNCLSQFGVNGKKILDYNRSKVHALLSKPLNAIRLVKQYGIKKILLKISEKFKVRR